MTSKLIKKVTGVWLELSADEVKILKNILTKYQHLVNDCYNTRPNSGEDFLISSIMLMDLE